MHEAGLFDLSDHLERFTQTGEESAGLIDISVPHFGYKNPISIDRKWRFIRSETTTDTASAMGDVDE